MLTRVIWLVLISSDEELARGSLLGLFVKVNSRGLDTSDAHMSNFPGSRAHDRNHNRNHKCAMLILWYTIPRDYAINTSLAGQFGSHVVPLGLQHAGDGDTLRPVPQPMRSWYQPREERS
jgi:hypothetical protein